MLGADELQKKNVRHSSCLLEAHNLGEYDSQMKELILYLCSKSKQET